MKNKNSGQWGITTMGLFALAVMLLSVAPQWTNAQEKTEDQELSPAARRAQIRDSLRQERLNRRKEAAQQTETQAPTAGQTTTNTPDVPQATVTPVGKTETSEGSSGQTGGASAQTGKSSSGKGAPTPIQDEEIPIPDSIMVEALSVRDTEVRDLLSGLATQYGVNIIVANDVRGPVSVNLNNIKLKDAVKLIAEENGYQLSVSHGALKVSMPEPEKPEAPPEPNFAIEMKDDLITMDIGGVAIDKVVRKLVDVTGKTIVLGEGAGGPIKAYYKDVVFEKAFKLMVESNGFRYRDKEGVLTIYKDDWVASTGDGKAAKGAGNIYVQNKKVTLEVANMPVQSVISSITAQAGISTVIYGNITGSVTAKLQDVSVTDVFQYLFKGTDYTFWLHKGIYFIGSKEMKAITNSKLIVLQSVKADEIMELIPPELIKDMKVTVVPGQNGLMAMGTYEAIQNLEDYIAKIDLPVPQILIEALVVDINMDKIRNYGVDMFLGNANAIKGPETFYPDVNLTLNRGNAGGILEKLGLRDVISLPRNFVARVEALEREKVLNIKSRPQIATLNGKKAVITVGQTQYFLLRQETDFNQTQTTTTRTQERFEKIQADVQLTVTPFVTGKGEITVEIIPDFSEPEGSFNSNVPPTINRRHLQSTVRLREGETIVLGGLVKESLNSDRRQFPILGSIPLLGWLFKNYNTSKSRTQLMIFVTPHIYYGADSHVNPKQYMKDLKLMQ